MSERDEFEAPYVIDRSHQNQAYVTLGFSSEEACTQFIKAIRNGRAATSPQAVPALTEPVAWHIGNPDGSMNRLGAIYHNRKSAIDHFDSYGGDFNASIVPLYAATQPSQEPEKAPQRYQD